MSQRDRVRAVLTELAEPIQVQLERDRSLVDLFNDLDTAVIKRKWFQDLWSQAEWEAICHFDESWRAAIEKYNSLPPWRQFWASPAGNKVRDEAAGLLRILDV